MLEYCAIRFAKRWPTVHAWTTTRLGGLSQPPFDALNLSAWCGDSAATVAHNQRLVWKDLALSQPYMLKQVHGSRVVCDPQAAGIEADGVFTQRKNRVCAIATADCLPVFLYRPDPEAVALLHVGWRGLVAGILNAGYRALEGEKTEIHAAFGPCICAKHFIVDDATAQRIVTKQSEQLWMSRCGEAHWQVDLAGLARQRLQRMGAICGPFFHGCTYADARRFYSYRRDGLCGRMLSAIWFE